MLTLLLAAGCAGSPQHPEKLHGDSLHRGKLVDVCAAAQPGVRCISSEELQQYGGNTQEALRIALWTYLR